MMRIHQNTSHNKNRIVKHPLPRAAAAALFWLALWQLLSLTVGNTFLLPAPLAVFNNLLSLLALPAFYINSAATFLRCFWGVFLSLLAGSVTAALSCRFSIIRSLLRPPVSFLKSVPVMAVIIYALLLLSSSNVPILACFLMCYPIAYTNLLSGLDHMDRQLLELAKIYRITGIRKFRHLIFPSVLPELKSALSLISGISWKSVVAAEVLSVPRFSMGYNLMNSKIYFETERLFAWVMAIIALSLLFETIIKAGLATLAPSAYTGSRILHRGSKFVEKCGLSPICDIHVENHRKDNHKAAGPVALTSLSKSFDNHSIFDNLSLSFRADTVTALMGPSGLGKTTLLRILSGLETPDNGQLAGLANKKISHLFQEDCLLPWLNVYDNLILVLPGISSADSRIKEILSLLELSEHIDRMPDELSGGMRRRVSLARALLAPSDLLLLDEPFEGLDPPLRQRLYPRLLPLFAGKTVLLVTHSPKDAEALADAIITL